MYYRQTKEPVEILSPQAGKDTENILADIFEHVPHFGVHTSFALENNCAELRAVVDAAAVFWNAPTYARRAINVGLGLDEPDPWMCDEGKRVVDAHTTTGDVSFSRRSILLDGVSSLLNGVVEMCEYRVEGKLSVGGVPIEVPPKGFFSIALD